MTNAEKDRIDDYAGQMEACIVYSTDGEFCGYNHKQCENIFRKFADEIRRECAEKAVAWLMDKSGTVYGDNITEAITGKE